MTASLGLLATQFLAAQPGDDTGGQGPDFGKASPVALVVLILLLIAVALLIRSMSKHLKRVPASFEPEDTAETGDEAATSEASESETADKAPREG